ncbi:MAG: alpha-amylase [Acidaminobacteraceae bacterium]
MKNGVMIQVFEWNLPADGNLYKNLKKQAEHFSKLGITSVWMPPAAKGTSNLDVGYGNYDFWDLGEFDQKGTICTKYGTKEELITCINSLHEHNIGVYADMVFNHKGGADFTENFKAVKVNPDNRTKEISDAHDIDDWTGFSFAGRDDKYSDFKWHFFHFNGVDYDQNSKESGIFRIIGENKNWSVDTDTEMGNFDYLMNANIDHAHPEVVAELKKVSDYMIDELQYDGFRYDALKHLSREFIDNLSKYILSKHPNFYFVGEYWKDDEATINYFIEETDYHIDLFDVSLHYNFYEASQNPDFDMRSIFDDSLVSKKPEQAVTFVDNHDSQPGQSLESWVQPWFKEIAYSLILLRKDGYPCIFWGDYDGINGDSYDGIKEQLETMLLARQDYAWGEQEDYFTDQKLIAWIRHGDENHKSKLVVLISTGDAGEMTIFVGDEYANKTYIDLSGKNESIKIDEDGKGLFTVAPGSVTYWTSDKSNV